jgi:hypothetical protein
MNRVRSRTLTSLVLAIGALVLGLTAQDYFWRFTSAPAPRDGLLVLAAAVALFAIAYLRAPFSKASMPGRGLCCARSPEADAHRGEPPFHVWRVVGSAVLLALSGVATIASLALFRDESEPQLRWLLYLVAILLYLVAVYVQQPPQTGSSGHAFARWRDPRARPHVRRQALALIAILTIGALFRLYRFNELPYGLWYDEADNGLWARQIVADPDFRPIYVSSTNLPAHFLYLIALSFRLVGDSKNGIRAVAVVFGMLTIVAAYHCGRELGEAGPDSASARPEGPSPRAVPLEWAQSRSSVGLGLMLAFLLAVSRWDVNWSRIGMHGVTVPFFELWVVAALLRALRTRRLAAFGWAGVALGLGLCFYSPFRVFPAILSGFLMAWAARRWVLARRGDPRSSLLKAVRRAIRWRAIQAASSWGVPAFLLVLGVLVTVAPVAQYARLHPDVFWDRAKKVSIWSDPEASVRPVRALLDSTSKHLLMFHYRGDPNGRHNLPGAPMLDRLSGILMVFGIAMCFLRLWDPRSVLLLLWFFVPLSGGILSTWFEAPQSLRSIGSLPAVYLLACLPMAWFAGEWRRVFASHSDGVTDADGVSRQHSVNKRLVALAVVLLVAIAVENGFVYFCLWGHDFASWAAFSAAETGLAQDVKLYREQYDLRFDPLLTAHLATRFLVPDYQVYQHFDPGTVFPLRGTDKAGIVLFVSPDTYPLLRQVEWLYPCGEGSCVQVRAFAHPYSGSVVMYEYVFSRETIASVQGLDGRYMPLRPQSDAEIGQGVEHRVDAVIDFAWGNEAPNGRGLSAGYPFEATWGGGLLASQYGVYTLQVDWPGSFVLELDGREVLSGVDSASRRIVMAQGVHALYLDGQVSGPGVVRLMWQTPDDPALYTVPGKALYRAWWPTRSLVGRFYANADWEGEPAMVRLDRQLAYYFHFLPLPRPYTVEWSGRLAAPVEGVYRLSVRAISSASLDVDGQPVIEETSPGQLGEGDVYLDAGLHDLRLRYLDDQSHSQVYLYWAPPGADSELVPPEALFPPAGGAWWPAP